MKPLPRTQSPVRIGKNADIDAELERMIAARAKAIAKANAPARPLLHLRRSEETKNDRKD